MKRSSSAALTTRRHWLDDPGHVRLVWRAFLVALVLTVLAGLLVETHPVFAIESWFGFNALFGFVACALMILIAKLLGLALRRPDTYYIRDDAND